MKHLVLRQLDLEIALRVAERVAEAEVGDAIDEQAEFHHNVAGGNLFVQHTGMDTGGYPRWQCGRIKAQFFDTVAGQNGRES